MSRSPTLAEVLEAAVAAGTTRLRVCLPARVENYKSDIQAADVQPLVQSVRFDESGTRIAESLPIVTRCPVYTPFGGGLGLFLPIAHGDLGLLIISDYSLDKWAASSGGRAVDPGFDHSHHLTDGLFIPGFLAFGAPRQTQAPTGQVLVGQDGGTFQGAALGHVLDLYHAALSTWLDGLAGSAGYLAPQPSPPLTESTTVKVTP